MKKVYIAIMAVIALAALGASILYASSVARNYDQNRNNRIDRSEAVTGIRDYFDGEISRDEAVDLFLLHYANHPVVTPTPTSLRSTSSPTPCPHVPGIRIKGCSTPVSSPTPRPTATVIPTPVAVSFPSAPTITNLVEVSMGGVAAGGGFMVSWSKVDGATSYQIAYKSSNEDKWSGRTTTSLKGFIERNYKGEYLKNGVVYTVYVRALNGTEYGNWSKPAKATAQHVATPTPTPTATHVPAVERMCRGSGATCISQGRGSCTLADYQEVSVLNPASNSVSWDLQFEFWRLSDSYYNGYIGRTAYFTIDNQGKWSLRFEGHSSFDHTDPTFYDHNVASGVTRLNTGQNARNTIRLNARIQDEITLSVTVNGSVIPMHLDEQDFGRIRRTFKRSSNYGSFTLNGNAMLYGSGVRCN